MASQTQLIGLLKKNNCYPDNQMAVILLQFYTYKINLPIKIISIFKIIIIVFSIDLNRFLSQNCFLVFQSFKR